MVLRKPAYVPVMGMLWTCRARLADRPMDEASWLVLRTNETFWLSLGQENIPLHSPLIKSSSEIKGGNILSFYLLSWFVWSLMAQSHWSILVRSCRDSQFT